MFLTVLPVHAQEGQPTPPAIQSLIDQMVAADKRLQDSTYTFHQAESIDGKKQPDQEILVKYRRPHHVYLKWVGATHNGRQLLYKQGWNDGKLRVSPGPWIPNLNLDPTSGLVMRSSRHSILEIGYPKIVGIIARDNAKVQKNPALQSKITDLGISTVHGEQAHCYETELRKDIDPSLYGYKVNLCINLRTKLPARIQTWDKVNGEIQMVEDYGFENIEINSGLTDLDFDPDNEAYSF